MSDKETTPRKDEKEFPKNPPPKAGEKSNEDEKKKVPDHPSPEFWGDCPACGMG